jgi:hypothetical protein
MIGRIRCGLAAVSAQAHARRREKIGLLLFSPSPVLKAQQASDDPFDPVLHRDVVRTGARENKKTNLVAPVLLSSCI